MGMKKRKKRQSCDNRTVKAAVKISLKLSLPEGTDVSLLGNKYADDLFKTLYSVSNKTILTNDKAEKDKNKGNGIPTPFNKLKE